MDMFTVRETVGLLGEYRIDYSAQTLRRRLRQGKIRGTKSTNGKEVWLIPECEIWRLIEAPRWEGTPYEEGIDDQIKIDRFFEEVRELKQRINELENENYELRINLWDEDDPPF